MRRLILCLLAVLGCAPARAQPYPSPRFLNLQVDGAASLLGGGVLGGTFTNGTFSAPILTGQIDASGATFKTTAASAHNVTTIFGDPAGPVYIAAPLLNQAGIIQELPGTDFAIGSVANPLSGPTSPDSWGPLSRLTPNDPYCNLAFENCSILIGFGMGVLSAVTTADHLVAYGVGALERVTDSTGSNNIALGVDPMRYMTAGQFNLAIGHAMVFDRIVGTVPTANNNVAIGWNTAQFAPGTQNVFVGNNSGTSIFTNPMTGVGNTGVGFQSLNVLQGATNSNTGIGFFSLSSLTTGTGNTALGSASGKGAVTSANGVFIGSNTGTFVTANNETFVGFNAGVSAVGAPLTGTNNVGIGTSAFHIIQGTSTLNVAVGENAGGLLTVANSETLIGANAGDNLTTGASNVMVGGNAATAATTAASNVVVGTGAAGALTTGANNVIIGTSVGGTNATSGNNNILIGTSNAVDAASLGQADYLNIQNILTSSNVLTSPATALAGTITLPNLSTAGTIAGSICATSAGLILYESGASSCTISLRRLKRDIGPVTDAKAHIMALRPVSFRFREGDTRRQAGFIAEDVRAANPEFSTYDGKGALQGYRENAILAELVRVVQTQQTEIDQLKTALRLGPSARREEKAP